MSDPSLKILEATPKRALAFTTAFYWRFILGFLFLNWIVNLLLLFVSFMGGGQLFGAFSEIFPLARVLLNMFVFVAVIYGALFIVLGSPINGFAVVLTDGTDGEATELDSSMKTIIPVWAAIAWKLAVAYLAFGFVISFLQQSNLDADGFAQVGWLQNNYAITGLMMACLYPAVFLSLRGVMNKSFKRFKTAVVEVK